MPRNINVQFTANWRNECTLLLLTGYRMHWDVNIHEEQEVKMLCVQHSFTALASDTCVVVMDSWLPRIKELQRVLCAQCGRCVLYLWNRMRVQIKCHTQTCCNKSVDTLWWDGWLQIVTARNLRKNCKVYLLVLTFLARNKLFCYFVSVILLFLTFGNFENLFIREKKKQADKELSCNYTKAKRRQFCKGNICIYNLLKESEEDVWNLLLILIEYYAVQFSFEINKSVYLHIVCLT